MVASLAICPQVSLAEGFTGETFLTWKTDSQQNYVRISVATATFVATRTNPATATCLDEWFAKDADVSAQRTNELLATISRNSEFHPAAVIVLALERECGSFAQ